MRKLWQLIVSALLLAAGVPQASGAQVAPLTTIDRELRAAFPDVASIDAGELQTMMDGSTRPVILDIREADEFAVSHLPGAVRVDPGAGVNDIVRAIGADLKGRDVIVYCSVGVRSTQLAQRVHIGLETLGARQIANLREGIFGWHNGTRPLVRGAQPTPYVHPYSALWGHLVQRQAYTSYEPVLPGKPPVTHPGSSELQVRLVAFLGVFALMALAEALHPRRRRLLSRGRRWRTHFAMLGLGTVLVRGAMVLLPVLGATAAATFAAQQGWGIFNWLDLPGLVEVLLAIVVFDLAIWVQHVVTHNVPLLWQFHKVHHADRDLDASSALRFHPVEILFSALYKLLVILAMGPAVVAVIAFEVLLNATAMFSHANWALPGRLDRALRLVIVTPDMHRIHHSTLRTEQNRNFGFCLSIWDRWLGTYKSVPDAGHDSMTIGLPEWQADDHPTRFVWLLGLPFRNESIENSLPRREHRNARNEGG
jgi:sterol desaturase/sphingolipid hydroxylase (fatty acid hydroxylase superfamily)/rhodanese-related sulfurtransferase